MLVVDGKKVSARELVKQYKIPMPPKNNPVILMRLNRELVVWDKANESYKFPVATLEHASYIGIDPKTNESVEIRYQKTAPQQTVRNGAVITRYNPRKMRFEGERELIDVNVELEKYVWWYLNPKCRQSPFHTKNHEFRYERHDLEIDAKAEVDKMDDLFAALKPMYALKEAGKIDELRTIAKGMKIANVDRLGRDGVIKEMLRKANENPTKFLQMITSHAIRMEGIIEDCIDKKIFVLKTREGIGRWYMGGKEITVVRKDVDATIHLKRFVINGWERESGDFHNKIKEAVSEFNRGEIIEEKELTTTDIEPLKSKEPEGSDFRQLLIDAIETDIIRLDGNKWKWVVQGKPFHVGGVTVPKGEKPVAYMINFLGSKPGNNTREKIIEKLAEKKQLA